MRSEHTRAKSTTTATVRPSASDDRAHALERRPETGRAWAWPDLVAVAPSDDCVAATRFARRLSETLDLEMVLVHIMPATPPISAGAVDPAFMYPISLDDDRALEKSWHATLDRWIADHGLGALRCVRKVASTPGPGLVEVARAERATMLGSRQLSLTERILGSSGASPSDADAVSARLARTAYPVIKDTQIRKMWVEVCL